ncbi:autotransporter outer membrane beta-barrel domain-containing protein [Mesorhizobium sp. VK23E]|nr:autotransporter outer membrane beta-barrel domain-containing protein [Mesorhizobium sp. VK23E]MDX8513970.1 autotransporter outer membrane beta-barrel domain-containing protein [Mesorhizobium sp. VK23E]
MNCKNATSGTVSHGNGVFLANCSCLAGRRLDLRLVRLAILLASTICTPVWAQDLSWSPNGANSGGNGTWDTASSVWFNGATLQTWNNAAPGNAIFGGAAGTVTVSGTVAVGGMTFGTSGYAITGGTLALSGTTPAVTTNAGVSATIGSAISGSATLVKSGAGTLTFSGAKTYTGATIVDAGRLVLSNATGFVSATTVNSGATLSFTGTAAVSAAAPITLNDGAVLENSNPSGTVILTGAVTSTGNTSINANQAAGTGRGLYLDGGLKGSGTVTINTVNAGTSVALRNNNTTFSGTLIVNGIANATAGAGSGLALGGGGTSNALINANVVLNGTIELADQGIGSGFLTSRFNLGALSGSGIIVANRQPTGNFGSTIVLGNTNDDGLFTGRIIRGSGRTNTVGVTKVGTGTQILSGASTYVGATTISAGVLSTPLLANGGVASGIGASANAAANLVLDGGTLQYTGTGASTDRRFTLTTNGGAIDASGAGALNFTNTAAIAFSGTGARALTLTGSNTAANTLAAVLGDNGGASSLIKAGAGTWVLTGANTYTGGTAISGGTLQVSADNNLGAALGALTLNGGTLENTSAFATSRGVTLNAGGGTFQTDADLTVSGAIAGAGALTKTGGATLALTGNNTYGGGTTISAGTLQLGNGGTTGSIVGDVLDNGVLAFDRSDTLTFGGLISGSGSVNQIGSGATVLTGNNTYTGATTVSTGTLIVNGDQSAATGPTSVAGGGTLGGTGIIGGSVTIANDGILSPGHLGNSPGTLTIRKDLLLSGGSILNYNFGKANTPGGALNDLTQVNGNLTLAGTINVSVSSGGSFDPGVYRVISYAGTLTNNTLQTGVIPSSAYFVQTSIDKQVNLVNTSGLTLNFWDGNAGPKNNSSVNGGDGVWHVAGADDNWTDIGGVVNAPYANGSFAIFSATPGTVTVDNSLGQVTAIGMQFASNGYHLLGGEIALAGAPTSIIRVGDGTLAGAGFVATIDNVLSGNTQLVKTDLGKLVLNGINTYTGGTAVNGGTLAISSDANLGAAGTALTLDTGTLQNTADVTSGRNVVVPTSGTFLTDSGTTLTLNGTISGAGNVAKDGSGTLLLNGAATNTGSTTVAGGTLQAGAANVLSAVSAFSVLSGATLDLNGRDQTIASLSNAGTVELSGAPGTALTVTGDYVGNGGLLAFNTALGNDASVTDRLVVNGSTAGTGSVKVTNVGGLGAPTTEGIKIIDIAGASNGALSLLGDYMIQGQQAVVGGAYAYTLQKNDTNGDWYLKSSLANPPPPPPPATPPAPLYQPGVPLYESYAQVLLGLNELPTLQQRIGNRYRDGSDATAHPGTAYAQLDGGPLQTPIWARIEGRHATMQPSTTSGSTYQADQFNVQTGIDGLALENDKGRLIVGLTAQYGTVTADVASFLGNGKIRADGYSTGATLTWYGDNGVYVDGQAQATWYNSNLTSALTGTMTHGNDGFGYAFGIEGGRRFGVGDGFSLTPQAQLVYSAVNFDTFFDRFGAQVSLGSGDSLSGRVGLSLDHQRTWRDEAGRLARSDVYGIANVHYEFLDGTMINVSGTSFANASDRLRGSIGAGGTYSWADGRYAVYGEISYNTSLSHAGDSYSYKGTGGFRVQW